MEIARASLYAKLHKCKFLLDEVKFFGHVISKDGVVVHPSKIEAVIAWPHSINVHEIRSFLEVVG